MDRPEFDIRIDKDGKLTVEVKGSHGQECLKLADLIRELVGREDSRQLTAEYYRQPGAVRIQSQVRGQVKP